MPSQHRKRQTFLVTVVWLLLMAMPSMTDKMTSIKMTSIKVVTSNGGQDLDNGEKVFTELVAGTRPVLLFAKLSDHSLLVVGSSRATMATTKLEDTFVFKLKVTGSGNNSSALLKGMKKIKSVWSQFTGPYKAMFAVGESIVLVGADSSASVLDTKSGTISKMTLETKYVTLLQTSQLLSSSKAPTFYYINPGYRSEFTKAAFDTSNLVQAKQIGPADVRHLCNAGHDKIKIQLANCQQGSVSWSIFAGVVDDTDFMLVEQQSNSIIRFSKATFESADGTSVPLQHIAANQFWRYSKPTAPPTTTHTSLSSSTTGSSKHAAIIASVCVVLLLLIIVPICVYCLCKKPSSDATGKAASSVSKNVRSGSLKKQSTAQQQSSRNSVNTSNKQTKGQASNKKAGATSKAKGSSANKGNSSAKGGSSSKRGGAK